MTWVCLTSANNGDCFQDKNKRYVTKAQAKSSSKNLLQSALHQRLEEEFTFQQNNNLQHKAKYTLELHIKNTVNVPE